MTTKAEAFRSVFEASLSDIADRTGGPHSSDRCIILSGGVDTCAILAAARNAGVTFSAAFTVITGDDSPDRTFAEAAAKEHGIDDHEILRITPGELVSTHLPTCVRILHTFDGMTLRNSLVIAAAFRRASERGFRHAVVGDGADELFGGYSFMWGNEDDPVKWREKRDSMCAEWTFATSAIAESFGMSTHSPYTEQRTVDWAIENTERGDCIGTRPIRLVHGGDTVDHTTGKLILREAYDTVASWRRKDPIEVGSGVTVIGHDPYWADLVSDDEFRSAADELLAQGYVIKSKEYLTNFRAFEDCFGRDGSGHPTKKRMPLGEGCVGCCFEIGDKMFCRVCGAYPAQR